MEHLSEFLFETFPELNLIKRIDSASANDMINECGYKSQTFEVETVDGYCIFMDRIERSDSFEVTYFQHGVVDSSFSWIVHGPKNSLAYKAYNEAQQDVFMGNFRGIYPRKLASWKDTSSYWDYSCDDYATDVRAFMNKIVEVKILELSKIHFPNLSFEEAKEEVMKRLKITYVGHSMGGMTLKTYVIQSRLAKRPHYLSKAILLSPAGMHENAPFAI